MKYIFIALVLLASVTHAKEYKVVFNCSAEDPFYIQSRMALIGKTIDMIEDSGDEAKVALTLHGGCVAMVSKNFEDIVDDNDIRYIKKAQEHLTKLSKQKKVETTVCAMSLKRNAIDKKEVLPFIKISPNSFIDTIAYQNDGYALMVLK